MRALAILAAAGLAAAVTTSFAAGAGRHSHDGWQGYRQDVKHIFVIVLENHSQKSVIGDKYMPYLSSLATKYAGASNYYGVTHPSEPNYLAMISGSNWWLNQDNASFMVDHTNLVDELQAAHKTWAAYEEAMPADKTVAAWPSTSTALYANKHNPFVHFTDIANDPARMANVKPYTSFASDLASANTTPNFSFIVPDQCDDLHGGVYSTVAGYESTTPCPYNDANDDPADITLKRQADAFIEKTVGTIMGSPAWHDGQDAIFIVSDEGDFAVNPTDGNWDSTAGCCDSPVLPAGDPDISPSWPGGVYGGGLVPAVVVVNHGGKTGGYVSETPYNHYSLLATIETVWHLPLLAYAADTAQVTPMTEFFTK